MHTDMILDMDNFDFSSIMDEDVSAEPEVVEEVHEEDDMFDWEREEGEDEVVEEDEVEVDDKDFGDFDESFSLLPDEYEIVIGDSRIAKKDLAQVVTAKDDILNTQKALDTFCAGLMTRQQVVESALTVAKTEVERQMEYVDSILESDDASPEEMAKAYRAKRQLVAREKELRGQAMQAQEALNAQRQQAVQYAYETTARQVTGGKKAVDQACEYARSLGIQSDALSEALSPALVNMALDAMRYRKQQEGNKARVSAAVKGKAPVSAAPKKSVTRQEASRKAAQVNKMKRGELTGADAFAFIVD